MKITRERALAVVGACGWASASEWDDARLAEKLSDVPEVAPEDKVEGDEVEADLRAVIEAAKAKEGFEIEAEGEVTEEKKEAKEEKKEAKEEKKEAKEEKKEAKEETSSDSEPKTPKAKKGRGYCAGQVLKKHGLNNPITDEMVAEVDEMVGKPNPKESRSWLQLSWHVCNGYSEEIPLPE